MSRQTYFAIAVVTALGACDQASTMGTTSQPQTASASQNVELTAQTDRSDLVDACFGFITRGVERDLTSLGYRKGGTGLFDTNEDRFEKEIPNAFFAFPGQIKRISLEYTTSRRGERTCDIRHNGARRDSGTGVLIDDFINRMQSDGWRVTRENRRTILRKGSQAVSFRGQVRSSSSGSGSLISFRSSAP